MFNAISRYTKYSHVIGSMLNVCETVTYLPLSIHVQFERSALQLASEKGHVEVVKCLLEKGASITDKDDVRYISS
jgi:ankyrin repeat protein